MHYSIEPRDQIYVKGYEFLTFATNICKNVSNKYNQKLLIVPKCLQEMQ